MPENKAHEVDSNVSTAIFTIVSKNYLHYALTLLKSVKTHASGTSLFIGLCDEPEGTENLPEWIEILPIHALTLPRFENFVFKYTILELNTAIKPFIFEILFAKGYEKVIYFDPDIKVYHSLQSMLNLLDSNEMLLTPHLTAPLDDEFTPNDLIILQSGSYNLGYLGLRNTQQMNSFLKWWQEKLEDHCVVDIPKGLFVDQKWMDLAPGLFTGVHIVRDEGWNVAYWNLLHRPLQKKDQRVMVKDTPLIFFHFSGFKEGASSLSQHQNRFSISDLGETGESLCEDYLDDLKRNGIDEYSKQPYAFGSFADGTPIPEMGRAIFREDLDHQNRDFHPFSAEGSADFMGYLNEPIRFGDRSIPYLTRLALRLYEHRPDLQKAFPHLGGEDSIRYANWFIENASKQSDFDHKFILPVIHELGLFNTSAPQSTNPKFTRTFKNLYRFFYHFRHLARPWMTPEKRQAIADRLLRRAYPLEHRSASFQIGVNLFGYVSAESGIGQSARSNIAALEKYGFPFVVCDFKGGNVSRKKAEVPTKHLGKPKFSINLFHINADQMRSAIHHLGEHVLHNRYNIGYWAWELPEFPDSMVEPASLLDEIWTPSNFCRNAIAAKIDLPVNVIPHSISHPLAPASRLPEALNDLPSKFFLTVFDALSVPERKNVHGTIEAFRLARENLPDNVNLVVKASNLDREPSFTKELKANIQEDGRLYLIDDYLHHAELFLLIQKAMGLISLHRSEGFGLLIAESMSLGTPVVATNWSGNTDFTNEDTTYLVDFELVKLPEQQGPYLAGSTWAQPNLQHAAQRMVEVLNDPTNKASKIGRAKELVQNQLSPLAVSKVLGSRLDEIVSSFS